MSARLSAMAEGSAAPTNNGTAEADPKAVAILAKNIYREFRAGGFSERDVMALAGELLALVTSEVRNERAIREG
jgi:hypothetical protein